MFKPKRHAPAELLRERVTYTVPQFCARNQISRPTYNRLRSQGRAPVEMRLGLNIIRITGESERDWQKRMEDEGEKFETMATERAVKAGEAGAKSDKHVSKRGKKSRRARPHKQRTLDHNDTEQRA